jgi:hypothetical protein
MQSVCSVTLFKIVLCATQASLLKLMPILPVFAYLVQLRFQTVMNARQQQSALFAPQKVFTWQLQQPASCAMFPCLNVQLAPIQSLALLANLGTSWVPLRLIFVSATQSQAIWTFVSSARHPLFALNASLQFTFWARRIFSAIPAKSSIHNALSALQTKHALCATQAMLLKQWPVERLFAQHVQFLFQSAKSVCLFQFVHFAFQRIFIWHQEQHASLVEFPCHNAWHVLIQQRAWHAQSVLY